MAYLNRISNQTLELPLLPDLGRMKYNNIQDEVVNYNSFRVVKVKGRHLKKESD